MHEVCYGHVVHGSDSLLLMAVSQTFPSPGFITNDTGSDIHMGLENDFVWAASCNVSNIRYD